MVDDGSIARIATAAGLVPVPAADDPDRTVWVGQDRVEIGVREHAGGWVLDRRERGDQREVGRFTTLADAQRLLALRLANEARTIAGRSPVHVDGFAPGAEWREEEARSVLTWPGGRAEFPPGIGGRNAGRQFSWVALSSLDDIADRIDLPDAR